MGVKKFRSIEEMDGHRWYEPGDPMLDRAIRRVWELGYQTVRPRFPSGVHKHRTVESMNALEAAWEQANFDAYHRRLKAQMEAAEATPGSDQQTAVSDRH